MENEWFRSPDWGEADREDFEGRRKRVHRASLSWRRLGMDWQEPLIIHGVRELDDAGVQRIRSSFHELLTEAREEHWPLENLSPLEPANS